jgi:cell division protein FtsW
MADSTATTLPAHGGAGRLYDPVVVLVVGMLMALGVVMVYSASVSVDGAPFDWRDWWNTPLRQAAFALAGFLTMLIAAHIDYRVLAWNGPRGGWRAGLLVLLAAGLLLAVLMPGVGRTILGARRALVIPGANLSFQPSEFAKIVLVIWVAALITRAVRPPARVRPGFPLLRRPAQPKATVPRGDVRSFRSGFVPILVSSGVLLALTGIEDFGTAALMGVVMLALLVAGGARWWHLLLTMFSGAAAGAVLVLSADYRIARIQAFLAGRPDLAGAGYQVHQGLLAIGSGGWWGRGLGAGVQKYGYIPYDNNDFILAVVCEELGIIGGLVVVGLFLLLLWRGWRIAARAPDPFGRLLALGLTLTICLQAAFNVAVVTNSVPTKGISLPFISAGGSGAVFLGLGAGLLAAVGRSGGLRTARRPTSPSADP